MTAPASTIAQVCKPPPDIALPVVEALAPYNLQIAALQEQIGAVVPRQNMKDKSGATVINPQFDRAEIFADNLPKYSQKIRSLLKPFRQQAERLERTSEEMQGPDSKDVIRVRPATSWTDMLTHGFGSITDDLLAASFIPFLVYFLLTWKHHARSATVIAACSGRGSQMVIAGEVSVSPYNWRMVQPSPSSMRSIVCAAGAAPPVRTRTPRGAVARSASGAFAIPMRTVGAAQSAVMRSLRRSG